MTTSPTKTEPADPPSLSHNQALGRYGEEVAARYLQRAGMTVLDRNWSCAQGEVDLVLLEGDTLVICEVKTRSSLRCGTPHEAVTAQKVARLRRLAAIWVREHPGRPRDLRIDLVAVLRPRRGPARIDHVRGLG